jgi:hypothetical protein
MMADVQDKSVFSRKHNIKPIFGSENKAKAPKRESISLQKVIME